MFYIYRLVRCVFLLARFFILLLSQVTVGCLFILTGEYIEQDSEHSDSFFVVLL